MDYISQEELYEPALTYEQQVDLYAWKKYMQEERRKNKKEKQD